MPPVPHAAAAAASPAEPRVVGSGPTEPRRALAGESSTAGSAWLWRALALLAGLAAAGTALRALPRLDPNLLDRLVVGHGPGGMALFVGVAAAGCAIGVPRQVAAFAAGYAFAGSLGLWTAGLLAMAAQLAGCAADFFWARLLARGWVGHRRPARLSRLHALTRVAETVAARPFTATLTLRLLPVGNNLALNLLAGVAAVPAAPFLAASAVGYLPQTAVCVLLGSGTHLARATELTIAALLFALATGLGAWLWRRPPNAAS